MYQKVRDNFRDRVRELDYVMTIHAEEEMVSDGFSIFDVENAILNGEIVERQRDPETGESKYLIKGLSLDEHEIIVVGKLSERGKLVIITVYFENDENAN